jgi:heat shock protein HslJ
MWKWYLAIVVIGLYGCNTDMPAPDKSELVGSWTVEFIGERPVIGRSPAFIQFTEDDKAGGNSSCNRFTSSYTLSGTQLSFAQAASTRMACPEPLMEQEQRFLAALARGCTGAAGKRHAGIDRCRWHSRLQGIASGKYRIEAHEKNPDAVVVDTARSACSATRRCG